MTAKEKEVLLERLQKTIDKSTKSIQSGEHQTIIIGELIEALRLLMKMVENERFV